MKKILFVLLVVAALVVVLPLSFKNSTPVAVDYFWGQTQLPLSWLVFGAFILGVLVALPFFALTGWGWKLKAKGLQKQVDGMIKQRKRDEIADKFHTQNEA